MTYERLPRRWWKSRACTRREANKPHPMYQGSGLKEKLENIDIEVVRERLLETSQVVVGHVGGFLTKLPVVSKLVENLQAEGHRNVARQGR